MGLMNDWTHEEERQKFLDFIAENGEDACPHGEDLGQDTVELKTCTVVFDTCEVLDIGGYETAIAILDEENGFIKELFIVERYVNREEARAAHRRWVEMARRQKSVWFLDPQCDVFRIVE